MREEDCGHAPFVYHIEARDPQTGAVKQRVSYCADCAAGIEDYRAGISFDRAWKSIPDIVKGLRS